VSTVAAYCSFLGSPRTTWVRLGVSPPRDSGDLLMALNQAAACGLYSQDVALRDVIGTLNQAGFGNEDICVMLSPTHPISRVVRDARILDPEPKTSIGAGAIGTGMIGWLSRLGAVLIPTVGFFARSQAFFHAMMAGMDSPALCASSRTLVALGFSEFEAGRFEHQLHRRGALIYVSCAEDARSNWAIQLLQRTGARETATLDGDKGRELMSGAAA
jgi:hypothetical protein